MEFVDKPRSFRFEDASIQVYKVKVDQGISSDAVLEDFKDELGASQEGKIRTGFYIQKTYRLDKTSKIYLIIDPGRSDKCVVVRPNMGRRILTKQYVTSRIRCRDYIPIDEAEAKGLWNQEFERADRPSSEEYQYGCKGRHKTRYIFAGSLIPVLNRMISDISEFDEDKQLFRVVRVETSTESAGEDLPAPLKELGIHVDALGKPEEDPEGIEVVVMGQGAAYEMKTLGSSILRGHVVARHNKDQKWVVEFSNGQRFKMNAAQVKAARLLHEKEVTKLVDANMARVDASSVNEIVCGATSKIVSQPILSEGHEETEKYEMIFEEHYQGTLPQTIVGIEFSDKVGVMEDGLMLWEVVLRKLAKKLLLEGAGSAHQSQPSPIAHHPDSAAGQMAVGYSHPALDAGASSNKGVDGADALANNGNYLSI